MSSLYIGTGAKLSAVTPSPWNSLVRVPYWARKVELRGYHCCLEASICVGSTVSGSGIMSSRLTTTPAGTMFPFDDSDDTETKPVGGGNVRLGGSSSVMP